MEDYCASFVRNPARQRASWFIDAAKLGRLDLHPKYQRKSVWSLPYRQHFVDSVLRNYPTTSVFLSVEVLADGRTMYGVLDGKQRLSALLDFFADKFATPDTLQSEGLEGRLFSELPDAAKKQFLGYVFTVEEVEGATDTELNEAFGRLNRNMAQLNSQELRHAQYHDSAFLQKFETLAEDTFWAEIGIASPARIRRMTDIEYVSDIYVLSAFGIPEGTDYLDEFYATFDEEIPNESDADERYYYTLDFLKAVNAVLPLKKVRLRNLADFYSLWAAVIRLHEECDSLPSAREVADRLVVFLDALGNETPHPDAVEYLDAVRQGSNKRANRELRAKLIFEAIRPQG